MEVKIFDMIAARDTLEHLFKSELPARSALKIARLIKAVNSELETAQEQINRIVDKYAKTNENGEKIILRDSPEFNEYIKEYSEITQETITLSVPGISIEDIEKLSTLTPEKMLLLEPFMEGEGAQ